jgi:hypothetical protein
MANSSLYCFKEKHLFNVVLALIVVLFQVCYASCSAVKSVNWPVAFFSNSGTFCVPSITHPGLCIGAQFQDCPGQSGKVDKPKVIAAARITAIHLVATT